ncbi:hypothetical protein [Sinorhizobium alkalisoli]|uniref:hypothetical protein n=1 Tax=Sinorhizobium alkalisoli TaxID=1752398 RepID=UPI00124EB9EF|nr:hypothetical protein [Sinorhizobium alkalisoli]
MGKYAVTLHVLTACEVSGRAIPVGVYSGVKWTRSSMNHPGGQLTEYRLCLDRNPSDEVEVLLLGDTVVVTDQVKAGNVAVI